MGETKEQALNQISEAMERLEKLADHVNKLAKKAHKERRDGDSNDLLTVEWDMRRVMESIESGLFVLD